MKITKIENGSLAYQALEFLYNEATKDCGDDPSDEIEQAYLTLLEIVEKEKTHE